MNKQYVAETQQEIAAWRDVSMTQENGGRHGRIVLHYKGESRIVVVSNTPSDARGIKNHIATVRRELRGLGASRAITPVNPNRRERERNPAVRIAVPSAPAPIRENPFEKLEYPTMTTNPIDAIFSSIDKLRYSEMLELAQILSDVACGEKLRRSHANDWARVLHRAANYNRFAASAQVAVEP